MSNAEILEQLLDAELIVIPYEEMGGAKQTSFIVAILGGKYSSFDFVDDERLFPGAVLLVRSKLDSGEVRDAIENLSPTPERLKPQSVTTVETSVLFNGRIVSAIERLTFSDGSGRRLTLSQDGAYYAYNLTLRDGLDHLSD